MSCPLRLYAGCRSATDRPNAVYQTASQQQQTVVERFHCPGQRTFRYRLRTRDAYRCGRIPFGGIWVSRLGDERSLRRFRAFRVLRSAIESSPWKGGSDRKFYRIGVRTKHSAILVKYGRHREENQHYRDRGVPEIPWPSRAEIFATMLTTTDLDARPGRDDLWSCRDQYETSRRGLYQRARAERVRCIQAHDAPASSGLALKGRVQCRSLPVGASSFPKLRRSLLWRRSEVRPGSSR